MVKSAFRLKITTAVFGVLLAATAAKSADAAITTPLRLISYTAPSGNWVLIRSNNVPYAAINAYQYSSAGWHYASLQTNGYPVMGSTIAGYYSPTDRNHHLFFIEGDGHIHEWLWPDGPITNLGAGSPSDRDVTSQSGSPLPAGTLSGGEVTGPTTLTGFVDTSSVMHLYFTDSSSIVHEVYYSGQWWEGHPAGQANALDGKGMTSLWDGAREHIYFTGLDGSLWEDWFSGGWQSHALTGSTGVVNPKITISQSPSGYLVAMLQGTQEIFGPSTDSLGMRAVIYDTSAGWESDEFTGLANLSVDSPMVAYNNWWFYEGLDQNIYLPGISFSQSLQSMFGGESVNTTANGSELGPISGFIDSSGNSHIFYIGTNGNLWQ